VEHDQSFSDDEKRETKKIKLSLYLNSAAVALKLQAWKDTVESSNKALDIDRQSDKALFRRAQAKVELEEFDDAKKDVRAILEMDNAHREARTLHARIKKLEQVQMKKDAKTFGGMFSKLGGLYSEAETGRVGENGEGFDAEKASGDDEDLSDDEKMPPVDIGNGFVMEEVTGDPVDGEGKD